MPKKKPLYAPMMATFGGGSVRGFGHGISVGGGAPGWITGYRSASSSASDRYYYMSVDSNDDIVCVGHQIGGDAKIHKFDDDGAIVWQKKIPDCEFYGVTTDSSDNIYVVGRTDNSSYGSPFTAIVFKLNSSGVIQWQRWLSSSSSDKFENVKVDSSGNVYCVGECRPQTHGNNLADFLIAKYNSSGTLQWYRMLGGTSNDNGVDLVIDSSNNIYAAGYTGSDGAGSFDHYIVKYNSSGTLQWDKTYGSSSTDRQYAIALNSSGNLLVGGHVRFGSYRNSLSIVNSSTGAVIDSVFFSDSSVPTYYSIDTDSSGNIYASGNSDDGTDNSCISKFDSSLNPEWHREFDSPGFGLFYAVRVNSNDEPIVAGGERYFGGANFDPIVAKIPYDGTGEGSYGSYMTYQDVGFVERSHTLSVADAVLTETTSGLTSGTSSLSISNDTAVQVAFYDMN